MLHTYIHTYTHTHAHTQTVDLRDKARSTWKNRRDKKKKKKMVLHMHLTACRDRLSILKMLRNEQTCELLPSLERSLERPLAPCTHSVTVHSVGIASVLHCPLSHSHLVRRNSLLVTQLPFRYAHKPF